MHTGTCYICLEEKKMKYDGLCSDCAKIALKSKQVMKAVCGACGKYTNVIGETLTCRPCAKKSIIR
jgi:hypothetical protein